MALCGLFFILLILFNFLGLRCYAALSCGVFASSCFVDFSCGTIVVLPVISIHLRLNF